MKIININRIKSLEEECVTNGNIKTLDLVMEMTRTFTYAQYENTEATIAKDTLEHYGYVVDIESEEKKPIVSPHNFGG
jgi:hypothetical protein